MLKNSEFVSKLRNSGLRQTRQRLKICEVLFNRDKTFHFTINDLAKNISENFNEKISLLNFRNSNFNNFKNSILNLVNKFPEISACLSNAIQNLGSLSLPFPKNGFS